MSSTRLHGMCLSCGYTFDSASTLTNPRAKPQVGDLTICLSCGAMMRFNERLQLVPASERDLEAVTPLDRRAYEVARQLIRDRGPIKRRETRN